MLDGVKTMTGLQNEFLERGVQGVCQILGGLSAEVVEASKLLSGTIPEAWVYGIQGWTTTD